MELVDAMKAQALKDLEMLMKNQLAVAFDEALKLSGDKVKSLIPGQVDDMIIDMVLEAAGPALKQLILEQLEKISA